VLGAPGGVKSGGSGWIAIPCWESILWRVFLAAIIGELPAAGLAGSPKANNKVDALRHVHL